MFNRRSEKLSVKNLIDFFGKIDKKNYGKFKRIVINGGEPTIHPQFIDINKFLLKKFPEKRKEIGTNLRLFETMNVHTKERLESIYSTYQRIQIGCDDEHKNIDIVEKLVPEFVKRGIRVAINSVNGFYSKKTKLRLERLKKKYGVKLMFSPLAHDSEGKSFFKKRGLCIDRRRDFLLDCDGKAYFCYQQEFEKPVFELKKVSWKKLNYFLFEYVPQEKYKFCDYCERFVTDE
jgi:organic radical activating enzyme